MTYVTTKEELKVAINRKDLEIIVSGKVAKDLMPIAKLTKEMPKILPWLAGAGAATIAAIAATAVPTGGLSLAFATPVIAVEAAAAGISTGALTVLVTLCIAFGITMVVTMLLDYDMEFKADGSIYFSLKKGR